MEKQQQVTGAAHNIGLALAVCTAASRKACRDTIPFNQFGIEQEITTTICCLCSDEARFITGQMISVNGGGQAVGAGLPALRNLLEGC